MSAPGWKSNSSASAAPGGGGRLGGYGRHLRCGGREEPGVLRTEFAGAIDEVGVGTEDEVGSAGEHRLDSGFDPTTQSLSAGLVVEAEDELRSDLQRAQGQQSDETGAETVGMDDLRGEAAQQYALPADKSGVGDADSGAEFEDAEPDSGQQREAEVFVGGGRSDDADLMSGGGEVTGECMHMGADSPVEVPMVKTILMSLPPCRCRWFCRCRWVRGLWSSLRRRARSSRR